MGEGGREEEGGERGNTIMYVYKVVIALRNLCLHSKLKLTADVTKEVHPTIRYEQLQLWTLSILSFSILTRSLTNQSP